MTGITRKDVRRLRALITTSQPDPRVEISPLSDVLHRWYTDGDFQDEGGQPRALTLTADNAPSFTDLVRSCAGDLPVGAIKVELIRCGAVVEDPQGQLHALRRYLVPDSVDDKLVSSLSFGLRGLTSTIAFNSDPARTDPPWFERMVESDPIDAESAKLMRPALHKRMTAFTEEIDTLFASAPKASKSTRRVAIGVFYYEDAD